MGLTLELGYTLNPHAHGWQPADTMRQAGEFTTAQDLDELIARDDVDELQTWERGERLVTLAVLRDHYIAAAIVDGIMFKTRESIATALHLLDSPPPEGVHQQSPAERRETIARLFRAPIVDEPEPTVLAYVAVVEFCASSGREPEIAVADHPDALLLRLRRVLAADATQLADHVDAMFLAHNPIPTGPEDADENHPVVRQVDRWLTDLAASGADPTITFHRAPVATLPAADALDPGLGLTRIEIETLVKVAAIAAHEFSEMGPGADYDAFDLAVQQLGDPAWVRDVAERAYQRVILGNEH